MFQHSRLAQGAHAQSVRREVSQLRAVMREAGRDGYPVPIRALVADLDLVARALREPASPIARSTGRARLVAVQRFIGLVAGTLGRDAAADLDALDALLPARRSAGWHATGTLVAGATGRRRRRGPTLDAADLRRLVDVAGSGAGVQAARDRALVALQCFSGLRAEEIVRLRWEDLDRNVTASGHYGLTATVERDGRHIRLLVPGPARDAVEALGRAFGGAVESLSGPVLRAHGTPGRGLSYRAARDVLVQACRRAGLPTVESVGLRAACAHWLRSQGLSDHETAAVLGLARVKSIDRLLRHHAALDAQRTVREAIWR
jgi:integrase